MTNCTRLVKNISKEFPCPGGHSFDKCFKSETYKKKKKLAAPTWYWSHVVNEFNLTS